MAQNRERCFMFSFLGEYNYHFPQPIPLKKKLKDYLEDDVDEKYYINNENAEKLIKQLIDNGTLPQHNHESRAEQTCIDGTICNPQRRDIANCIKARYDCGISNQQQVGNMVAKICIDTSMSGLEDGAIRTYRDTALSITAREYKEPRMILE